MIIIIIGTWYADYPRKNRLRTTWYGTFHAFANKKGRFGHDTKSFRHFHNDFVYITVRTAASHVDFFLIFFLYF